VRKLESIVRREQRARQRHLGTIGLGTEGQR
jgi:hypothetical protein